MSATTIDNVRVLLQSLPAAAVNSATQPGDLQTPGKIAAPATPLRAKNPAQLQIMPEKVEEMPPSPPEEFWRDLQQFHERRGTPLTQPARISGKHVDLYKLYNEVTERGGFNKVTMRDEWDEVYSAMETLRERCVNGTASIKHIYRRYLDKYERLNFFGEDPDKMEALEAAIEIVEMGGGRSRSRFLAGAGGGLGSIFGSAHSTLPAVPMAYNQRQHSVNVERRRQYKMSTQLHRHSSYEKLLLSLLSPLPNEQDFAINVCTLMANEARHTLQLSECPKLLDVLLAHLGVYADFTMRQLFQHSYTEVRHHSQLSFWRDLLHDKPQVLELYTDEQAWLDNGLISKEDGENSAARSELLAACDELHFLNLRRSNGTDERMGQRVLQIVQLVRTLSFHQENHALLASNRTLWRYLVMGANVRWSNIHIQALETAGNLAQQFELLDPTTDELSRNLLATLCEGIDSNDRAVIMSCLEILYKLCGREGNSQHINRCLGLDFYQRAMLLLSLTDVMMIIFTLEAVYALSALGARPCSMLMQVRGLIDQLVTLITVEAQSYGTGGCILMRVVEVFPGNMAASLAQNMPAILAPGPTSLTTLPTSLQVAVKPPAVLPTPTPAQTQVLPHGEQTPLVTALPGLPMPSLPQVQLPVPSLPQVQLPPIAATVTLPSLPSASQSFTHEDEQYALAWLGATYERAGNGNDLRVEQAELYRIYLSHCQKAGKLSVVNHMQFPRLVRLIFNQSVGPVIVRHLDGIELPGTYYVGIRMRAQPLAMQQRPTPSIVPVKKDTPILPKQPFSDPVQTEVASEESVSSAVTPPPSSSLIKSLLANKVTERQQKQKAQAQTPQPPALVATTASGTNATQPIKVTSTAISAFVNNPLMQHTPVKVGQTTIKPLHPQMAIEKKPITDSAPPPLAPLSGANVVTKDASGRTLIIASAAAKRKLTIDEEQNKRLALDAAASSSSSSSSGGKEEAQVTPSKNAANLYADLAASILEDEDMDDVPPLAKPSQEQSQQHPQQAQQLQLIPAKVQPTQRQLVFPGSNVVSPAPHSQLKLATTATIKTDQGLQTVPVILQPKTAMDSTPAPQTQYVLATNQQGQTYLVAQQPTIPTSTQSAPPTLLVTQTPQQQTKTIIILQQPGGVSAANVAGTQKMIMTTAQGQQVLVTTTTAPQLAQPRTSTPQQQIFIAPQRPVPALGAGQMSPSLLSQLNQIPATIKLHQPQPQPQLVSPQLAPQQRLVAAKPGASLPIPQLQQHQSIIQQHIISGPSTPTSTVGGTVGGEKRQVILGGIKETTLITQTSATPAPLQQSQLNSQTIITQSPTSTAIVGGVALQQQHHIRSVLDQQQQHHPSIIQQKITMPAISEATKPKIAPVPVSPTVTLLAKKPAPPQPAQVSSPKPSVTQAVVVTTSGTSDSTEGGKTVVLATSEAKPAESEVVAQTVVPPAVVTTGPSSSSLVVSQSVYAASGPNANPTPSPMPVDANWLYICDWRNCPRKKFKSLNELQYHVCSVHCPDHLDSDADIYCQWGSGPNFCDNRARKRYSLMTHLIDRHLTTENLRASVQRRLATGIHNVAPTQAPVTIVRNEGHAQRLAGGATGSPSGPASAVPVVGSAAMQAMNRHTTDYTNAKELMDENEGPVTKSIRLTAALIIRNLVTYSATAKRSLKRYESRLANVAFSNVEASGVLSHIMYELSQ
uniref:Brahma associated protein 170kD n=2 Tax=Drosophila melanogaster TaxID=7227 RepID=A1Z6M0_DROME|nr:brahma associated protein 170kD [Drosophila melanogaster]AAF57363.1 brahma associated protein 170kD [Drosophila melanogaster]AGW52162.1 FI23954p1 [Drosophila melanogaster]|eukprot:NP_610216.1 brahma associated protein 170kD [Drosophila melanogaster]